MKRTLSILFMFFILSFATRYSLNAQVINETVTINPGYTHQVFYSMPNGAYPAVDNTNWDIAFQMRGFAASIMINSKNNVQLYRSMKSVADWNSMIPADTTGIINATYELHNSDLTWDKGAFSATNDINDQFDLGWGEYDFVTHIVSGDSLYFIKLSNGTYKKFWLESLTSGVYYFRWANLDGSNETMGTLAKSAFAGKYFAYYSIQNNVSIDREPLYNAWDLVFTQYLSVTPFIYKVAGVLSNDSVFCAKAYPVDINNLNPVNYTLSADINTIGYNWKNYDFNTNTWTIEDSLVYFVKDRNAGLWKVIFTGFGGAATGVYNFTKELLGTTGVSEHSVNPLLNIYPNPSTGNINLVVLKQQASPDVTFTITNSMGQIVRTTTSRLNSELNNINLELNGLKQGFYLLSINQDGRHYYKSFIID